MPAKTQARGGKSGGGGKGANAGRGGKTGKGGNDPKTTAADPDDLDTLSALYRNGTLRASKFPVDDGPSQEYNDRIRLWRGPIENLAIFAIVNAADETLLSKRGVSGAIFARLGDAAAAHEKQCSDAAPLNPGEVLPTDGDGDMGDLNASYIFHAVGPDSRTINSMATSKGNPEMQAMLRSCYRASLETLLQEAKQFAAQIAFPAISTGDNGFDHDWATPIALAEVRRFMDDDDPKDDLEAIVFCVFDDEAEQAYRHFLPIYFPPTDTDLAEAPPEPKQTTTTTTATTATQIQGTTGTARVDPSGVITRGGKGRSATTSTVPPVSTGNAVSFLRQPYATVLEALNHHWPSRSGNVLRMRTWASDGIENDADVVRIAMMNEDGITLYPQLSRPGRRV